MFAFWPNTMRAHAQNLFLSAFLALSAAFAIAAPTASAQFTVKLLSVNGAAYNVMSLRPLNKKECDSHVKLSFLIENLPGSNVNPAYIELWVGPSGTDCNVATRNTNTNGMQCMSVASKQIAKTDKTISSFEVTTAGLCGDSTNRFEGTRTLYFLGVNSLDSNEVATVFSTYGLLIDQQPPAAPTGVSGGVGDTEIPINWSSTSSDVNHFELVWDPNASSAATYDAGMSSMSTIDASSSSSDAAVSGEDGGTVTQPNGCSSKVLMAGDEVAADPKSLPTELLGKTIEGKVVSTKVSGSELGSKLVAVGVVAVDLAGNASPVSNITCISVVPTTGFWGAYKDSGGTVQPGCTCSLPGQPRNNPLTMAAVWPIALALLGLVARTRRRRS